MKIIKKTLKVIIIIAILIFFGGWLFLNNLKPKYRGKISLTKISDSVTVYYDEVGVPHINATNNKDAYTALGYVHAQDRLWQMELLRRVSSGRLAEIFGKELIAVDKFFSGLGIEEAAQNSIKKLDKNSKSYQLATAYLNGINQFIEKGKMPLEFYMAGVKKEKYTLKDIYNVYGYMAYGFAVAHKTDPMLTEIKEKLGSEYLNEILGAEHTNLTLLKSSDKPKLNVSFTKAISSLMNKLPVASFIGSNAWVIGATKTKNGKVIFANDPHISYSQPSVWYQAHIKTPSYEMYGFNLALTPFPLLGHNRNYAYGLTMFQNDDIDFYFEENNPANSMEYKTPLGYKKYQLLNKTIKVKNAKDSVYQIKISQHGPLMNSIMDNMDNKKPMAMQWIYTKLENRLLELSHKMAHAKSLDDFKSGRHLLYAPGLNIMYGDAKNNIAWFATAKLYKYRDSLNRKLVLNGASGKDEIQSYLNFEQNPQAINPSWDYVYSANNQPDTIVGVLYPGYYLSEDRALRIETLLKANNQFSKENVAQMICDITSSTASEIIDFLAKSIDKKTLSASQKKALYILKQWNGYYGKEEAGPVIYSRLWYEFLKNTFKDEIGDTFFNQLLEIPLEEKLMAHQAKKEQSIWWDDINTKNLKETKKDIVTKSFKQAVIFLQNQLGENIDHWKWERVVEVEHEHTFGKAGGILKKLFNVGPFKTEGGNQVINNQIYKIDSTGYYKIKAGASTRRVIDFSDIENSLTILPTGQSGNILSPFYRDQAQMYLEGKFVKMKLNQQEIKQTKNILYLLPQKKQ
ncbi:MAG: penicillin acylase family protein [Tenacibaculum sp.]